MILIACEESQAVTKAFRNLGREAFSCDMQPCSGGHPEWHIQGDVKDILTEEWEMVIAFPPCTHICSSSSGSFREKIWDGSQQAGIEFFRMFTKLKCPWAIENPIGIMSTLYREPNQIIQPWMFGHNASKATCLWLNRLPKLKHTEIIPPMGYRLASDTKGLLKSSYGYTFQPPIPEPNPLRWGNQSPNGRDNLSGPNRGKIRSKTYNGIAKAMAKQWS